MYYLSSFLSRSVFYQFWFLSPFFNSSHFLSTTTSSRSISLQQFHNLLSNVSTESWQRGAFASVTSPFLGSSILRATYRWQHLQLMWVDRRPKWNSSGTDAQQRFDGEQCLWPLSHLYGMCCKWFQISGVCKVVHLKQLRPWAVWGPVLGLTRAVRQSS